VQFLKKMLVFVSGRRMCLGDVLAKMELFLFFSSLVHTFDIRLPEGETLPSLKGNTGVTVTPDSFKVSRFLFRNLLLIVSLFNHFEDELLTCSFSFVCLKVCLDRRPAEFDVLISPSGKLRSAGSQ
jgi:hypothetical protein